MDLDRFDARILSELQRDGGCQWSSSPRSSACPPRPARGASRRWSRAGVIEGYAAILNPARVGLEVQAIVHVKLTEHTDETRGALRARDRPARRGHQLFAMAGTYDFILQVFGKDLESLSAVILKKLLRIPHVRDVQSSVVLATVKRSTRVPSAIYSR